jgi:hypothetical protein
MTEWVVFSGVPQSRCGTLRYISWYQSYVFRFSHMCTGIIPPAFTACGYSNRLSK